MRDSSVATSIVWTTLHQGYAEAAAGGPKPGSSPPIRARPIDRSHRKDTRRRSGSRVVAMSP